MHSLDDDNYFEVFPKIPVKLKNGEYKGTEIEIRQLNKNNLSCFHV
jgi:hypothetical protein